MINEQEWKDFFEREEKKMEIGSPEFYLTHKEIMNMIEAAKNRNNSKRKKRRKI